MRTLWSITGHTLRDRIPNQEIWRICDIQDIVRFTRQRRREGNQHINRMEDNRIAKIARDGKPYSRRPPARPPKMWRDSWMSTSRRKELLKAGKTGWKPISRRRRRRRIHTHTYGNEELYKVLYRFYITFTPFIVQAYNSQFAEKDNPSPRPCQIGFLEHFSGITKV